MQKFIPALEDIATSNTLECEELRDSSSGLVISLRRADGSKLSIHFEDHLAYRLLDEGDALEAIHQLGKSENRENRIYIVENSEFIEWFHNQSYGVRRNDKLSHYIIFSSNDIIDVISLGAPTLKSPKKNGEQ